MQLDGTRFRSCVRRGSRAACCVVRWFLPGYSHISSAVSATANSQRACDLAHTRATAKRAIIAGYFGWSTPLGVQTSQALRALYQGTASAVPAMDPGETALRPCNYRRG